jgi:hypothetical protein
VVRRGEQTGPKIDYGRRLLARATVSTVDFKHAFLNLVDLAHLCADFRAAVARIGPPCSAFTVQLPVDFVPKVKPNLDIATKTGAAPKIVIRDPVRSSIYFLRQRALPPSRLQHW